MKKNIEITLVVPLYNEANRVGKFLQALVNYRENGIKLAEVRFVSDGSVDNTVEILSKWRAKNKSKVSFNIVIKSYKQNMGRGYAIRTGLKDLHTEIAIYIDGDLDIPLSNISNIVFEMNADVDLVLGSKKIPGSVCTSSRRLSRMIVGYGHSILTYLFLSIWHWDWQGGIKGFRKGMLDVILPYLTVNHWGFDLEITYFAHNFGYSVKEIPLTWGSASNDSRVRLIPDSVMAIKDMLSIRKSLQVVDEVISI